MFGPCSGRQDREGEEATTGAQRGAFKEGQMPDSEGLLI